ncbi:MAG: histidine kinase dimerization/phospho-acceptor domain-containing protein, partial [Thermodesulfobacteriota bacterium]
MKHFGLRFYILLNILIICALGMIFIGIISIKLTERTAIESKISGTTAVIKAFENTYLFPGEIEEGIEFLKNALDDGSWGTIRLGSERFTFKTPHSNFQKKHISGSLINRVNLTRNPEISIDGLSILPFKNYKAYKIAYPIKNKSIKGTIFIYEPLDNFNKSIETNQKFLVLWVILFILLIAIFGYYLLSKTVVKPVQKLIDLTIDISNGITPFNIDVGSISEINKLQNAMIKMSEEIEISKSELLINITNLEEANKKIIETQKELVASEKLASLGRLSAGVAHEIGNPLSAINGYVEVLKKGDRLDNDQTINFIEKIESEIDRINKIISTLLDYTRPKEPLETNIDLNEIINSAIELLSSQGVFKNINLTTNLS